MALFDVLDDLRNHRRNKVEADPYLRAVAEAATEYRHVARTGLAVADEAGTKFVRSLRDNPSIQAEIKSSDLIRARELGNKLAETWGRGAGLAVAGAMMAPLDLLFAREKQARAAGRSQAWINRAKSHRLDVFPDPAHPLPPIDQQELAEQRFWGELSHGQAVAETIGSRPELSEVDKLKVYDRAVASSGYDPGWVDDAKRAEIDNGPQLS